MQDMKDEFKKEKEILIMNQTEIFEMKSSAYQIKIQWKIYLVEWIKLKIVGIDDKVDELELSEKKKEKTQRSRNGKCDNSNAIKRPNL
jgi:hypothetical protein